MFLAQKGFLFLFLCKEIVHFVKGRFWYQQAECLILKNWSLSSHVCVYQPYINLTFGDGSVVKWYLLHFWFFNLLFLVLNIAKCDLTIILNVSVPVIWIKCIIPGIQQYHSPLWMYTVSKPFSISGGGSERTLKKKTVFRNRYDSVPVMIHFTLQETDIICNTKLLFLMDVG